VLGKIEKLLQRCDLKELQEIQKLITEQIKRMQGDQAYWNDQDGRKRRREERFETNLLGTLTRITDIKPGERKEYSVTIQDISRSGMCVRVDTNFTPSRVVEITFAAPGGKIKRCFMEVVRVRRMSNENGSWLEVGCRSASNEEVRRVRLQEEQIAKMRSKLHSRRGILIMLVGNNTDATEKKLTSRIKTKNYTVRRCESVFQAYQTAEKVKAQ